MFRDKMKIFTTVVFVLSLLMGELFLAAPGLAYASSQATKPVASVPQTTARWTRCTVDGDMDGDDWCWVAAGRYFLGNGMYGFRNGRYFLRNRFLLPNGLVIRNGYIMRNGQIVGYMNNFGNPFYYGNPILYMP
jgi:hypothetical protein